MLRGTGSFGSVWELPPPGSRTAFAFVEFAEVLGADYPTPGIQDLCRCVGPDLTDTITPGLGWIRGFGSCSGRAGN